jgi:hypothetical protein
MPAAALEAESGGAVSRFKPAFYSWRALRLVETGTSNTTIAPAFDLRTRLRFVTNDPIKHVWPRRRLMPWRLRPGLTLGLGLRLGLTLEHGFRSELRLRLGRRLSLGLTMRLRLGLA